MTKVAPPKASALHEDLGRAAHVKTSSDRSFGLVVAGALLVVGGLPLLSGRGVRWWSLAAAAVLALLAGVRPSLLAPLNRAWTRLGLALGEVTAPVVLGLVFYLAVTPIGLVMRRCGHDLLRLKREPDSTATGSSRRPPGPGRRHHEEPVLRGTAWDFLAELWRFMRVRKKFWLLPILLMMVVFGGLVVLTKGSAVAPFIYTLF